MFLFFTRQHLFALILVGCAACSSKKPPSPPTTVKQNLSSWDYEQIRKSQQAEEAATVPEGEAEKAEKRQNCVVMSQSEMRRGKARDCVKLDPRAGHGEDAFCCAVTQNE